MNFLSNREDRESFQTGFNRGRDPQSKIRPALGRAWEKVKTMVRDYADFWDRVLSESKGREPTEDDLGKAVAKIVRMNRESPQGGAGNRSSSRQERPDLTAFEQKQIGTQSAGAGDSITRQFEEQAASMGIARGVGRNQEDDSSSSEVDTGRQVDSGFTYQDAQSREEQEGLGEVQRLLYSVDGGKFFPGNGEDPTGDGYYGANTKRAVKKFAEAYGIETDGNRITPDILDLLERLSDEQSQDQRVAQR